MLIMMKNYKSPRTVAHVLGFLSLVAAVLAAVGFFGGMEQLWDLAGTQWILIAMMLGIYAIMVHQCADQCCGRSSEGSCEGGSSCCKSEGNMPNA